MFFMSKIAICLKFTLKTFCLKLYKRFLVKLYNKNRHNYSGFSFYLELYLYHATMKLGTRNNQCDAFSEIYDKLARCCFSRRK